MPYPMKLLFPIIHTLVLLFTLSAIPEEAARLPIFETFDLAIGETVETRTGAKLTLVSVNEPKGAVWGEISRPEVTVTVDGE